MPRQSTGMKLWALVNSGPKKDSSTPPKMDKRTAPAKATEVASLVERRINACSSARLLAAESCAYFCAVTAVTP
ncbi:hypothetical protein G5575_13840 [Devosia chinhatensis]|uniref:Uncharacterized protein n=1 Tax=Devosia aurantiaca TaxID=2714858 RepID=A0A6M1SFF0_9HYPH|nr:hypothetical protein [Devosia aurantiaca]NGP18589.1 hypothetical protein [Devosia aurantiaca]